MGGVNTDSTESTEDLEIWIYKDSIYSARSVACCDYKSITGSYSVGHQSVIHLI